MNEVEILSSLVNVSSPLGILGLGVFLYKIWTTLERLQKSYDILNHNSSSIVKALLSKGILQPDDIKDVELA